MNRAKNPATRFALVAILCAAASVAQAQTIIPANAATSGPCIVKPSPGQATNPTYTFNAGASGRTLVGWTVLGDLTYVSQAGTTSLNTVTVSSTAAFGKGRVTARLDNCSSVSYDVFKNFSVADDITGPKCVAAGDRVAFTIRPSVSSATQIAAGIGIDTYRWRINSGTNIAQVPVGTAPYFAVFSGDGSAVTITAPSTDFTIGVTVGSCNPQTVAFERTKSVSVGPATPAFLPTSAPTCRSLYNNTVFTLTLDPATVTAGAVYSWNAPGWTITSYNVTNGQNTGANITPSGTAAVDVVVTATTGGGGTACNTRTAVFHTDRMLEQTPNFTSKNYITAAGLTCFTANPPLPVPVAGYTFTLNGLIPSTNPITWEAPLGWTITSTNGGSIITARPSASAVSGHIKARTVACPSGVVQFYATINGPLPSCTYYIANISTSQFPHNYGAGVPVSPDPLNTCSAVGDVYTWTLLTSTGTLVANQTPNPTVSSAGTNTKQFNAPGDPITGDWPNYTVQLVVTNPTTCNRFTAIDLPNQVQRFAHTSGGGGTSEIKDATDAAQRLSAGAGAANEPSVYPSPAHDVLNLVMPLTQRGTTQVELVDASGKVCRTLKTEATWTPVAVGDLRNGTYAVRLTLPDGTRTTRTVVVSH